jgi:uncharacterized membrane protein (DUF4010 family)
MEFTELISRFAAALGIGLLIGLERGWRTRDEVSGGRAAGIRTFAISALLGGVVGGLGKATGDVAGGAIIGLACLAYAIMITIFCREENRADKTFSATTAVAAILTFALGIYALVGDLRAAVAVAVATVIILALRETIHGWVTKVTWIELRSGLVLLAMTFVALPIMPDSPIGPYGGINLREVWLIAIILATVSFSGYIAMKYLGASRGVLIAAAAGGLASSTAVTIANARRAAAREASASLLAAGVALASAIMFLRVCAIILALNPALVTLTMPALAAAAVTALAFAIVPTFLAERGGEQDHKIRLRNPFNFWAVIGFALLLAFFILAGRVVAELAGGTGAIIGAAIVGIADVDAITVSMTRLAPQSLALSSAALAILAAVSTDTISKIAIGAAIGRGTFAAEIALMAFGCHVAAGIALWLTFTFAN